MTEPAPKASNLASRDYWDIVMSQLRKRPSVRIALVLLALLYASAIYAPFLAGDRPLLLRATDAAEYKKAQKLLVPIASNLASLAAGPAPAGAADGGQDPGPALRDERDALVNRALAMRRQLSAGDGALLDELVAAADAAERAGLAGHPLEAQAADRLRDLARRAKTELLPCAPGEAPVPGHSVALVPRTTYPALEAIGRGELYLMLMWLAVLTWPLWNRLVNAVWLSGDPERIRRARLPKLAAVALLPLLALPWWSSSETPFTTSAYKAGLTSGEITVETAVFPLVPFGLAEQNDAEIFRPPTWRAESEISESGDSVNRRAPTGSGDFQVVTHPVQVRYGEPPRNAASRHPLGTDSVGRDLLARMIWGGRVSLSVGLVSTLFLAVIGTILGAMAGFHGGRTDVAISRLIEIFQCFPVLFLILIVVAFVGPGLINIMIILGVTRWTGVARLARGEFLRLRGLDFVVASEALGVSNSRTIFRHILPNALGPILVICTFSIASGILTESTLSFLGLGIELPIPSWGSLLTESRSSEYWWIQVFPGLMIFLTVTLFNLLGEGVADALDPRQKI